MEILFVIGFVIFIGFLLLKKKVDNFNALVLLPFPEWAERYEAAKEPARSGVARAFLAQAVDLAIKSGRVSNTAYLSQSIRAGDPNDILEKWMGRSFFAIKRVCGEDTLQTSVARDVGLLMAVCMSGGHADGELKRFLVSFEYEARPSTGYEHEFTADASQPVDPIASGFRKLGNQGGCAPSDSMSDQEILYIYRKVCQAFKEAAGKRGEELPEGILNAIAWKFLQISESMGAEMVGPHLDYEIEKYLSEGLRPEYRQQVFLP